MSGAIPDHARFEILAVNEFRSDQGGLVSLQIPVMKFQQSATVQGGKLVLSAANGGVVRAEATTAEGITIELHNGGAVAMDNLFHGKFRSISRVTWPFGGLLYAANMELMIISEPDWKVNTNLNMIVAPKMRMINGNFETVANPFPLLESITGSILLKHEPGTPVSQITVFDTPKIGRITNLSVTMEQGVRWPQLEAQADWSGVSVFRLNSDGSRTSVGRSEMKPAQASAVAMSASPSTASSKNSPIAATKQAAAQPPKAKAVPKSMPKQVRKPPAPTKPVTKPAPKLPLSKKR